MKDKPLVSMITYCFNGERFVHKYFEAILSQTYTNIELIFFNNGSIDKTGDIAEDYKKKLENRGIRVQLIHYKENQNTCRLKQEGFSLMHGEYFFGCDSDDIIHPTYIEEMCGCLVANPEKGIVFCQLNVVDEASGKIVNIYKVNPNTSKRGAFLDMLLDQNTYYTAISYMINRKHFLQVNGDFTFEISKYGENPQIQLPLLYHELQIYINKPLGDYTVRIDSYTGQFKTDYLKQVNSFLDAERKLIITLNRIKPDNQEDYEMIVKRKWRKNAYYASLHTQNKDLIHKCYSLLKEINYVGLKERIAYYAPFLYFKLLSMKTK